jgi:HK97 family phage portal protein
MGWFRDWLLGSPKEPEVRSITSVPWNVGSLTAPGVTQERALTLTPVFAAVRHIVDFGSTLPLKGYREIGDERQPMASLPRLFADLETLGLKAPWLSQGLSSLVLRGNAVGLKNMTDGFGFPTNITWVSMDRVHVDDSLSPGMGNWFIDGRPVSRLDLVHIPWITVPGRTLGLSPIQFYAATINASLDAQSYGGGWFAGGGFPPAVFKNTAQTVTPEQADGIRERLVAAIRGRKPLVTGSDWEYTPVTIPPGEAQFIETQKLSANQIAAIYGIEPQEIGGEAANGLTYNNEELRQTKRLANIRPYLTRFEDAFASWLPEKQFVKFTGDAIVRSDLKTRYETYAIALSNGFLNLDEVRELEDRQPLPDGQGQSFGPKAPAALEAPAPDSTGTPSGDVVPMRRPGT